MSTTSQIIMHSILFLSTHLSSGLSLHPIWEQHLPPAIYHLSSSMHSPLSVHSVPCTSIPHSHHFNPIAAPDRCSHGSGTHSSSLVHSVPYASIPCFHCFNPITVPTTHSVAKTPWHKLHNNDSDKDDNNFQPAITIGNTTDVHHETIHCQCIDSKQRCYNELHDSLTSGAIPNPDSLIQRARNNASSIRRIGNRVDMICMFLKWTYHNLTSGCIPNPDDLVIRARDNVPSIRRIGYRIDITSLLLKWAFRNLASGCIPNPDSPILRARNNVCSIRWIDNRVDNISFKVVTNK